MPRKQRLVKERARRLAEAVSSSTNPKKRARDIKKAFEGNVRDVARAYTEVALAEIISLMTKSKSEVMRKDCAALLLERGWGKPAQAHVGGAEDDSPIRHVHEVKRTLIRPKKSADS